MKWMEHRVGEVVEIEGRLYHVEVSPRKDCSGCDLRGRCGSLACTPSSRDDNLNTRYRRVDQRNYVDAVRLLLDRMDPEDRTELLKEYE
jgi:hypothetical protein